MRIIKPARKDFSKCRIMHGCCRNCHCVIECFEHETKMYDPRRPSDVFVHCLECGYDIPVKYYKD